MEPPPHQAPPPIRLIRDSSLPAHRASADQAGFPVTLRTDADLKAHVFAFVFFGSSEIQSFFTQKTTSLRLNPEQGEPTSRF